ncbi:MAG TPA: ATP-binding protein [Thermodesulfobacteriota bacterium]|nr:ATP-binding protein [Thermodesulfobacteriota bacterium]
MVSDKSKTKRSFSLISLGIFSGILLVILIINGLLEINRTRNGFYLLLEREAAVLIQHFEKNIQEALTSLEWMESEPGKYPLGSPVSELFLGLEDSVAEYLLEAVHRVDQIDREKTLSPSDFRYLVDQYHITSIEITDAKGNRLRGWPSPFSPAEKKAVLHELIDKKQPVAIDLLGKPLSESKLFSLAVWRRTNPEIIALYLNGEQMKRLLRQFAIQRAITDIGLREGILYISVQDPSLNVIANTDPGLIGSREEDSFLKGSLHSKGVLTRHYHPSKGKEIFEVVKPFSFKDKSMGLIRIGYSPEEIRPILGQIKKNVVLSVFFFLIFGIAAITLIGVNQNRHLKKMKEMEDRVRLAERLSSLGHLAAGVAHEIRNPLNAIGMGLQRLKREFLPQEERKREEYISFTEIILREIRRVNEIIEQFLTLSRPFQLNLKKASLQDVLGHLVTLFQEEASSQGIRLEAEIPSDLPMLTVDPPKLTQALINIMKNAMQAMGQGGILRVEARSFKDRVEVTISDSGSGIPPEQMEKVFNYYYTTKEKGVGLGLPIAHRIIEAHGGQLNLESRVGTGTKVIVTLPIEER